MSADLTRPVAVTEATFEREVAHGGVPVLVDFWAPWCGPCQMIAPVLEEIAHELAGRLKVAKLDVDQSPGLAQQHGVFSIPTLILFKDGQPVERLVGFVPRKLLLGKLRDHLEVQT